MVDKSHRRVLKEHYRENPPEAGVYRLVNSVTGRTLLGTATNLPSVQNKLDFATATDTPGALDRRLHEDAHQFGPAVFRFEVLEVLSHRPGQTDLEVKADLQTLLELWRENLAGVDLY